MTGPSTFSDLQGLENLTTVTGNLFVQNTGLSTLEGLNNLTSVEGGFLLTDNYELTTLKALSSLSLIGKTIVMSSNRRLFDLQGLEGLTSIASKGTTEAGNYGISLRYTSLINLRGLDNVTTINYDLDIAENDMLTSLKGLDKVTTITGSLRIQFNGQLSNCCSIQLGAASVSSTISINYNAPGCNSPSDLIGCSDLPPVVNSFTLIDNASDRSLRLLEDQDVVNIEELPSKYYTVRANVFPGGQGIRRVEFQFTVPAGQQDVLRSEYAAPYALFSDDKGDYFGRRAYAGSYQLTAIPYYLNSSGEEVAGRAKTISFTVTGEQLPIVNSFTLINNNTDEDVRLLEDGDRVSLDDLNSTTFTIRANVLPIQQRVRRVEFRLDAPAGQQGALRSEYAAPYSLFSDDRGDYFGREAYAGEYKLTATPYYLNSAGEEIAGTNKMISFTFTDSPSSLAANAGIAYPVPFQETLTLKLGAVDLSQTQIQLVHGYGQVYAMSANQVSQNEQGLVLNLAKLPSGPYTVRVMMQGQLQTFRVSKK